MYISEYLVMDADWLEYALWKVAQASKIRLYRCPIHSPNTATLILWGSEPWESVLWNQIWNAVTVLLRNSRPRRFEVDGAKRSK